MTEKIAALLNELNDALGRLTDIYQMRDENVRQANRLMIAEHNTRAQIDRINVDLVREGANGPKQTN